MLTDGGGGREEGGGGGGASSGDEEVWEKWHVSEGVKITRFAK